LSEILSNFRKRFTTETRNSSTGSLVAFEHSGQPVWTPRDYTALAREGFMQNAVAYRCVRMISEAASSVQFRLFEDRKELEQHPLLSLLETPNPSEGRADLLERWYGFLMVAGNSYMEAVSVGGKVRELHVLRPDRMKVIPGIKGWPEAYEYRVADRKVSYNQDVEGVRPILHMRQFHPLNDHYGMSPIEAAAYGIDIHNAAGSWNKSLLDNSARPSGALVYNSKDGNMSQVQFERLKEELENGFSGQYNAGRPLLLEGGLDWKQMGYSPRDMDFIEAKYVAAREIALAIGVPPMLLGIPGDNTYSNYSEANRTFWRQTVLPLVTRSIKSITTWLAPQFGENLVLSPDLNAIDALASEREARWDRIGRADFLTTNEKRQALGYPPLENGDTLEQNGDN
jgi:HK97 family phage portal protein